MVNLNSETLDSSDLIRNVLSCSNNQKEHTNIIAYIFKKINEIVEGTHIDCIFNLKKAVLTASSIRAFEMLIFYKKMLSAMIFDSNNKKRTQNQRQIISNLINTKKLVKIYEYKLFTELRSVITDS